MLLFFLNFDVIFQRMNIIIPQNISFSRSHVKLLYRYTVERKVQRHVQARKARSNLRHVRHVRNVIYQTRRMQGTQVFLVDASKQQPDSNIMQNIREINFLVFVFLFLALRFVLLCNFDFIFVCLFFGVFSRKF